VWVETSTFRETNGMLFACLLVPTSEYGKEIGGGEVGVSGGGFACSRSASVHEIH